MADGPVADSATWWVWAKDVATWIVAGVGWVLHRQIKRIDKIESEYMTKGDIANVTKEIKDGFSQVSVEIKDTHKRIDAILMQDRTNKRDA